MEQAMDLLHHAVKSSANLPQFITAVLGNPLAEIPLLHTNHMMFQTNKRTGDPIRYQYGEDCYSRHTEKG
ncbi:hypothetical protein D3C74_434060 [compost metagenome]